MDDNVLKKIQHLFEEDLEIKKEMICVAPPFDDGRMDLYDMQEYEHKLEDSINVLLGKLKKLTLELFGDKSVIYNKYLWLDNTIRQNFSLSKVGNDLGKLNRLSYFYNTNISNMTEEFRDSVKENVVGYFEDSRRLEPLKEVKTINEFLHFIHSYITNDEKFLQSINLIDSKVNEKGYTINYRGVDNPIFRFLFKQFPYSLDTGYTDMVAVSDKKMVMMVRDRGHALLIDITLPNRIEQTNDKKYDVRVEYFIPKIINVDMVNSLWGINKVNESSIGATGMIYTTVPDLPGFIATLINKVPTDSDMKQRTA